MVPPALASPPHTGLPPGGCTSPQQPCEKRGREGFLPLPSVNLRWPGGPRDREGLRGLVPPGADRGRGGGPLRVRAGSGFSSCTRGRRVGSSHGAESCLLGCPHRLALGPESPHFQTPGRKWGCSSLGPELLAPTISSASAVRRPHEGISCGSADPGQGPARGWAVRGWRGEGRGRGARLSCSRFAPDPGRGAPACPAGPGLVKGPHTFCSPTRDSQHPGSPP